MPKFRGAGQGVLALAAEPICAGIGRALELPVPEVVFASVDSELGRNEGDPEIRQLLQTSLGNNLAMDYLPGSAMFDPAARDAVDAALASRIVWFDAFIANVGRTARNSNILFVLARLVLSDRSRRGGLLSPFSAAADDDDRILENQTRIRRRQSATLAFYTIASEFRYIMISPWRSHIDAYQSATGLGVESLGRNRPPRMSRC